MKIWTAYVKLQNVNIEFMIVAAIELVVKIKELIVKRYQLEFIIQRVMALWAVGWRAKRLANRRRP